jgi:hypothetical protein
LNVERAAVVNGSNEGAGPLLQQCRAASEVRALQESLDKGRLPGGMSRRLSS